MTLIPPTSLKRWGGEKRAWLTGGRRRKRRSSNHEALFLRQAPGRALFRLPPRRSGFPLGGTGRERGVARPWLDRGGVTEVNIITPRALPFNTVGPSASRARGVAAGAAHKAHVSVLRRGGASVPAA